MKIIHGRNGKVRGRQLATGALKTMQFTGRASAGNITVTGIAAGDVLVNVQNVTDGTISSAHSVYAANTIAQSGGTDLSAKTFLATVKGA